MQILVVDNYDSFVFNLVQYLGQLSDPLSRLPSIEVTVWRNDDPRLSDLSGVVDKYDGILLSPGPGTPQRAGSTMELVTTCAQNQTPVLGVCLGHQAIGAAFGGVVERAPELLHGKTSLVYHDDAGILSGLPNPFVATRYHSLTVREDTLSKELEVTARTEKGIIMGMQHKTLPIYGVQFHPESILTQGGHRLLANWLKICGYQPSETLVSRLEDEVAAALEKKE